MFEVRDSRTFQTVLLFLIGALLCSPTYSKIIFVDDDAAGANDGTNWENAYVYLQDALTDANDADKPVEIRVAQGIYKPDQGLAAIPGFFWPTATFQLINGVIIKGGYADFGETDPNARDVDLYETILSGDLESNDEKNVWESTLDNSFHIVTGSWTDNTAVLDGFVLLAGRAHGSFPNAGGGIYNESGDPNITNCTFTANSALFEGGGMYNINSSPTITNCTFSGNRAEYGGGMYNHDSNPILTDCKFTNNTVYHWYNPDKFWGNGGGMLNYGGTPILTNCVFIGNSSRCDGGGMDNYPGSSPILTNCTFSGNSSKFYGGGMRNSGSNPILTNCTFSGNLAYKNGSGIFNQNGSHPVLINCIFSGNSARYGNALACFHGSTRNSFELVNCIVWDGDNSIDVYCWPNYITYSNIQGGWRWGGEGNINVDPLFVKPGYWADVNDPNIAVEPFDPNAVWINGDYHLKSEAGRWDPVSESWITDNVTSPCIDAGDPNSPVGDEPDPNGGRINMGAYGGTAEASKSPGYSWWFETTQGPVLARGLGIVLPHEHIFTDLRGPTTSGYGQADAADVVRVMAPLLSDARDKGVGVLIECSSIGVGRNVEIIAQVAEASGLPIVVPTGVYGRANFAPPEHRNMTEDELASLFISEFRDGIEGTGIKAGFIKISTDDGPMNALIERILRAAGRAASETGAAIASHTSTGSNAVRQVDILEAIDPAIRFIWVHAQNESNRNLHLQLAARGAYIEFDSLGWNPAQDSTYISAIKDLLAAGHGDRILLSHDAGWYRPGEANGGTQKPYTYLIDTFILKLRDADVDDATIRMITQTNPVRAFGFKSDE